MRIITVKSFTRTSVKGDLNNIYLFGDNFADALNLYVPSKTQAVIRGLPNAVGICTKNDRFKSQKSYLSDNQFEELKQHIDEQLKKARILAEEIGGNIKISEHGIGTGAASLSKFAPKINNYLQDKLKQNPENW